MNLIPRTPLILVALMNVSKIGSVRRVLEGCIVNNTPLGSVSGSPANPMHIKPAALFMLRKSPGPVPLHGLNPADHLSYGRRRWRRLQYLAQELRWRPRVVDQ